ncbi:MAG: GNAT family N-acetyltransferase [Planctomycetota bacterium]|nr:GNAT family N-acetyltransferase [Planctomycetota bacterium]
MSLTIRPARPEDCPTIVMFIRELAIFEKLEAEAVGTSEQFHLHLFGERPACEAIMAEWQGEPAGFALYFTNFSTFMAKPGLYLEDLYVRQAFRRRGIGKALITTLAEIALSRDYGRFEWSVLNWNSPAIAFYRALGAVAMDEWTVQRVSGPALEKMAAMSPKASLN